MNRSLRSILLAILVAAGFANATSISVVSVMIRYGMDEAIDTLMFATDHDSIPAFSGVEMKSSRSNTVTECPLLGGFSPVGEDRYRVLISGGVVSVNAGDSVRLHSRDSIDSLGSTFIVVSGDDRLPIAAWYDDANSDGAVDAVTLRFASPQRSDHSFIFHLGGEVRTVPSKQLAYSADSLVGTANLSSTPFARGQTAVDSADCGLMTSKDDGVQLRFAIFDSAGPILLKAELSQSGISVYKMAGGSYDTVIMLPDTLVLTFSEPVGGVGGLLGLNVIMGPSREAPQDLHGYRWMAVSSFVLRGVLFASDSSGNIRLSYGDSVCVQPIDAGGSIVDLNGNSGVAAWVRVASRSVNGVFRRSQAHSFDSMRDYFGVDGRSILRNSERAPSSVHRLRGTVVYGSESK